MHSYRFHTLGVVETSQIEMNVPAFFLKLFSSIVTLSLSAGREEQKIFVRN